MDDQEERMENKTYRSLKLFTLDIIQVILQILKSLIKIKKPLELKTHLSLNLSIKPLKFRF